MLTFPWASTGAFFCNNNRATFILPYLAAKCKGVNPFLVVAVREALFSNKTDATCIQSQKRIMKEICLLCYIYVTFYNFTSSWPSLAAIWSGVYKSFVVASTPAPCCSSNITISTLPKREATWSGVCSSYEQLFKTHYFYNHIVI